MQKLLILAVLAAAPLGQTAFAQYAPATPTVIVQHDDLDLQTAEGTRTLKHRIRRAVHTVCGAAPDFDLEGLNAVSQCRRDTQKVAVAQVDRIIARATRLTDAIDNIAVRKAENASAPSVILSAHLD